ncbi:hypothetical protein MRX96_019988 [Rhipicephalus microplus]
MFLSPTLFLTLNLSPRDEASEAAVEIEIAVPVEFNEVECVIGELAAFSNPRVFLSATFNPRNQSTDRYSARAAAPDLHFGEREFRWASCLFRTRLGIRLQGYLVNNAAPARNCTIKHAFVCDCHP